MKVVLRQIQKQLYDNSLLKMCQSAFRKDHGRDCCAESSWLPIREADGKPVSLIALLDLSVAFYTLELSILPEKLKATFGDRGFCS